MKCPLFRIFWRDIQGAPQGWKNKEDLVAWAEKAHQVEFITVGYLIYENKNFIVLAATIDGYEEEYNDASMILKSVITKREKLK